MSTMKKPIKIGLLGAGSIMDAHLPGFEAKRDLAVISAVAVNRKTPERVAMLQEKLGSGVQVYDSYQALLAESDVDAVDILLPHDLHLSATVAAAKAGKHVLIEKVMARNVWECDRMIEACETNEVTLTVCHDRRYNPEWVTLKRVVESGLLGKVHFWKLEHNQDVDPKGLGADWIANRDRLGGGAVMSCLTHQIDALRWFGGEVSTVTCTGKVLPERMEGESIAILACDMADGALAQLSINWTTKSGIDTLREDQAELAKDGLWYEMVQVGGDLGEAYYLAGRGVFVCRRDDRDPRDFVDCEVPNAPGGFARVVTEQGIGHPRCVSEWIHKLCHLPAKVVTDGRQVRGTVEVAEAAGESMRLGRRISLPVVPKPWGDTTQPETQQSKS
ncbi:MAG: Gfo/Idh/MocA family oxidoreductase [Akkermansiaceae bacterium]|jgi:UDP-N-acetyl-2-amino-2-deoxyglucuronate dehydrogenase|nr:Gfo/Idh/MocA family oxidoreductase [Akkermansiaceae bacterium]